MADETGVINKALGLLKAPPLTGPEDQSSTAQRAREFYPDARDAILTEHPWNFATVRMRLAQSTTTPAIDWSYQYPLPTNPYCLVVRTPDPHYGQWEVGVDPLDGRVLFSDNATMIIKYTARIENLNIWNPLAVQALTYLLATELAMPITGQIEKMQAWFKAYSVAMEKAITSDSREGSPVVARAPTVLSTIRHGMGR